uniref:Lipid membrane protein n=1 Tax=Pithovirus LCPAC401 TaxID=2506595 RepID=A0A481Z984_9VIRU|nr:MAG: lipid membrane protein [Pithovirus LCPAC401]
MSGKARDINIDQTCTASTAGCVLSQDLSSSLDNILDAINDQEQSFTDSMISLDPSSQVQKSIVKQTLNNKISQIANATCNASAENLNSNQLIYVTGSGGDINISQSGDAIASCVMNTVAKQQTFNTQQASDTQGQVRENVFVQLFSSIGMIILIVGIIIILVMFLPEILKTIEGKGAETGIPAEAGVSSEAAPVASKKSNGGGIFGTLKKYAPQLEEGAEFLAQNPELLLL